MNIVRKRRKSPGLLLCIAAAAMIQTACFYGHDIDRLEDEMNDADADTDTDIEAHYLEQKNLRDMLWIKGSLYPSKEGSN